MTTLDWIILAYIALAVINGFRSGLIHMIGSIIGVVVGVALAGRWYDPVGSWLGAFVFSDPLIAQVVGFSVLMLIFNRLFGLAFVLLNKVIRIINIIPGVSGLNRLAGAGLGFVEAVLIAGVTLYLATKFNVSPGWSEALEQSVLRPMLVGIAQIVVPLLPNAIKSVQSIL
ncbi:MAG: CvpA family protein [Candidatus Kerfeldbacteria bacterium]|nr:CvpA family protein [Candidatus Kerfeldbacteria bacterium]